MKLFLFIMSLGAAVAVFALRVTRSVLVQVVNSHLFGPDTHDIENQIVWNPSASVPWAVCVAVATLLLWPVVGAIVVGLVEVFREWAYQGREKDEIFEGEKMGLAAVWPLTLLYALVVYPTIGIIHRLF